MNDTAKMIVQRVEEEIRKATGESSKHTLLILSAINDSKNTPTPPPPKPKPAEPEREVHRCSACDMEDNNWKDGSHTVCGAKMNEANIAKFELIGSGVFLFLNLVSNATSSSGVKVARVEIGKVNADSIFSTATQIEFYTPDVKKAVLGCQHIVLHSDNSIKVNQTFITLFISRHVNCEKITLSPQIEFKGEFSLKGWYYNRARKTFAKRRGA